jgi:adenylate cyclase
MLLKRIKTLIMSLTAGKARFSFGRPVVKIFGIVLIGLFSIGGLITLRAADPFVVREARHTAFDLLQRASPRAYLDAPIKIVDINERSLEKLGQWPWPRDRLAEMVDRLHAVGAAAVVFDVLFVEPDRMSQRRPLHDPQQLESDGLEQESAVADRFDNDRIFADAISRGNVVLGFGTSIERHDLPPVKAGFAFTGEDPAPYVTQLQGGARLLPVLAEAAAGIGSVNLRKDNSANAVRVVQLLWSDGDRLYPSLISEALRIAQGAQTYVVNADQDIGGVQSLRIGAFEVPTGPKGELYLYYTEPRTDRYVSAADLFDNERLSALAPELAGRIILVGTSAAGLFDLHRTALGHTVPGVEMHAQAMEQIMNGQFLVRKDWTRTAEFFALVIACLAVGLTTIFGGARVALLVGAAISSLIAFSAWYAFRHMGMLVDFSFPLGGGMAVWFGATAFRYMVTDKEKRGIRNAFSHYVHPSVLKQIERNHSKVQLGGENCDLTVLFTDIRNFTPLSERLSPAELVAFLNRILGRLGAEIARENGVIDKFIGDSVMAFWNAPLRQPDHARRACAAALKMRAAIQEMNANSTFGLPEEIARDTRIEIGVGINTGPACVGNVGSAERFNYSAIGDAVNVAARAEAACKEIGYDLVICRSTAEHASEFAFLDAGSVTLKGKSERIPMMILVGDESVRTSPQFAAFVRQYSVLIESLNDQNTASAEETKADCLRLAKSFDSKLTNFIELLPARRGDFQTLPDRQLSLSHRTDTSEKSHVMPAS